QPARRAHLAAVRPRGGRRAVIGPEELVGAVDEVDLHGPLPDPRITEKGYNNSSRNAAMARGWSNRSSNRRRARSPSATRRGSSPRYSQTAWASPASSPTATRTPQRPSSSNGATSHPAGPT